MQAVQHSAGVVQAQLDVAQHASAAQSYPIAAAPFSFSLPQPNHLPLVSAPSEVSAQLSQLAQMKAQLLYFTSVISAMEHEVVSRAAAAVEPAMTDAAERHFLVVDTCVLMTGGPKLDGLVRCLLEQATTGPEAAAVSLLIPTAVVRELDGLKQNRQRATASYARRAISLLADMQRARGLYRGQREEEILSTAAQQRRGDDSVLDCMRLFHNNAAASVTLVTLDHNFALRAKTEGFEALDAEQAQQWVRERGGSAREAGAVGGPSLPPPTLPPPGLAPLSLLPKETPQRQKQTRPAGTRGCGGKTPQKTPKTKRKKVAGKKRKRSSPQNGGGGAAASPCSGYPLLTRAAKKRMKTGATTAVVTAGGDGKDDQVVFVQGKVSVSRRKEKSRKRLKQLRVSLKEKNTAKKVGARRRVQVVREKEMEGRNRNALLEEEVER